MSASAPLPDVPYAAWRDTKDTLHLFAQQVGKVKLACTPPQNHWWHATLAVDARGITSGRMVSGGIGFDLSFDLIDHALLARTDDGHLESFALLDGLTVASFNEQLFSMLAGLGLDVTITPAPFGVPMTTPFAADVEHRSYDEDFVHRYWRGAVLDRLGLSRIRRLVLRQDEPGAPVLAQPRSRSHSLLRSSGTCCRQASTAVTAGGLFA